METIGTIGMVPMVYFEKSMVPMVFGSYGFLAKKGSYGFWFLCCCFVVGGLEPRRGNF